MVIKQYSEGDEKRFLLLLKSEGKNWECYHGEKSWDKYKRALKTSCTYVAYEGDELCGYIRCRDDDGLCVFVYDLLVNKKYRGQNYGRKLIEKVCADYPEETVYILSGADGYYEKQGFARAGSIFETGKSDKDED